MQNNWQDELGDYYEEDVNYAIVSSPVEIKSLLESKGVSTWGQGEIGNTGW